MRGRGGFTAGFTLLEIVAVVAIVAMLAAVLLPLTCNERPARSTISFFATGMSCGGTIVLSRLGVGFEVRVNWLTGGIEVAARNAPST